MMTPQLDPKLFLASKPAVGPVSSAVQTGMKSASPLNIGPVSNKDMPPPQPKAASPNPLASAFATFAKGFAPQQTAAVDERYKAEGMERNKKALTWLQQTAQLPADQRAAFTLSRAQDIARDTGQSYEAVVASARDPNGFSDDSIKQGIAAFSAQLGMAPEKPAGPEYQFLQGQDGMIARGDKTSGGLEVLQPGTPKQDASDIRQVGNQIVERQADGSWKPVYEGSSPAETARAFQGFIDAATGEQMVVMSNGQARGTGRTAYIPPQMSSVGGVPMAVDKRTLATTELSPLTDVAGNEAARASAVVQGKAQGQAAFDLPAVELRSQTAINSINDLKSRNIGQRFGMQGKLYAIPGTDGADVQSLVRQVTSQAFLNAFDQLRGAGAITEVEGQAATAAITRLQDQNISVAEALNAMDELQGYYRKGIQVARQRAVKAPVLPERPAASAGIPRGEVPFFLAKPQNAAPAQIEEMSDDELERIARGG